MLCKNLRHYSAKQREWLAKQRSVVKCMDRFGYSPLADPEFETSSAVQLGALPTDAAIGEPGWLRKAWAWRGGGRFVANHGPCLRPAVKGDMNMRGMPWKKNVHGRIVIVDHKAKAKAEAKPSKEDAISPAVAVAAAP